MSGPPLRKTPVKLETARFLLRTLRPSDASKRYMSWADDKDVMTPLNTPTRKLTRDQLANYIGSFDGVSRFLIGIFDRKAGNHIGFYLIELNQQHCTAKFNVVIGDKDYWGEGVVNETRAVLLDYFFDKRNVEKAIGLPLARNFPAIFNYKAQGWRLEGVLKGQCRSLLGEGRIDQYQFALLKDEWRALKERETP